MLLEALEQEVVNGSKVVVAAVLQRLGSRDGRVRMRPQPPWPLGLPMRLLQVTPGQPRTSLDKLVLKFHRQALCLPEKLDPTGILGCKG